MGTHRIIAQDPVPPELIGRIAPTRTEGINLRGVLSFPIEQYAEHLLPTPAATRSNRVSMVSSANREQLVN